MFASDWRSVACLAIALTAGGCGAGERSDGPAPTTARPADAGGDIVIEGLDAAELAGADAAGPVDAAPVRVEDAGVVAGADAGADSPCAVLGDRCTAQLATAVSLNDPICPGLDKGWFGFMWDSISNCSSRQYSIPTGASVWFLMDASQIPAGYGGVAPVTQVSVIDYMESRTGGLIQGLVYPLDQDDRLTNPPTSKMSTVPAAMSCDADCCGSRPLPTNLRYLIKVEESGAGVPISVFYGS